MIGLIVAGLAVGVVGHRPLLGVLLCMLAATIKVPAVIPAGFIILDAVRRAPAERRLPLFAKLVGGRRASRSSFVSWACGLGWGWIGALGIPGTNRTLLTPTTFLAHWISVVVGHETQVLNLVRTAGALTTVVGVAYLLWRAPKIGTVRACGFALALIVALGPIVLPWYVLWGLVPLAAVGRRIERGFLDLRVGGALDRRAAVRLVDARRRVDGRGRGAHRARDRDRVASGAGVDPPRPRSRDRGVPPAGSHRAERRRPAHRGPRRVVVRVRASETPAA